ncbi:hypothetical protein DSO57_1039366 [Entomophthora muscae]|uniref:Uncharacterized protein n=1 Tax=Entomophthora muscae TaxID=34485 RepID=A0ACC2TX49_9FUNG|nr:hypothetical protein DSO57_1039366 [Entomophthora muscae]
MTTLLPSSTATSTSNQKSHVSHCAKARLFLNSRNLKEFQKFHTAQDLILDGSFLHVDVELPELRELSGRSSSEASERELTSLSSVSWEAV